jgi:hypothetical protein
VHPQLQVLIDEFGAAQARLHRLVATTPVELWPRRPEPERWSMAECVAHLNLTAAAFVPALRQALAAPGLTRSTGDRERYRRDPLGWLLWKTIGPPVRFRIKTPAPFVPGGTSPVLELIAEFDRWQEEQMACVHQAEGLPLGRIWIRSPFNSRMRYNLYSALTVLPRHQQRHLWQAEQARAAVS